MKQFCKAKCVWSKGETKQPDTASAMYLCCQDTHEEIVNSSICHLKKNSSSDFLRLTVVKILAEWVCCSPVHPDMYCRLPSHWEQWLKRSRLRQFAVAAQRSVRAQSTCGSWQALGSCRLLPQLSSVCSTDHPAANPRELQKHGTLLHSADVWFSSRTQTLPKWASEHSLKLV